MKLPDALTAIPWAPRRYEEVTPISAREVRVNGEQLVQVCSTQYLGMLWRPGVASNIKTFLAAHPSIQWGSMGSAYLGGTHPERIRLEALLARRCGTEAALFFSSGWAANYAIGEVTSRIFTKIMVDRRIHNSLRHGLRVFKGTYAEAELPALDVHAEEWPLLIGPTLEGQSGESCAPPAFLRENWIADECHSFGTVGQTGFETFDGSSPAIRIVGFSKAVGFCGAAVCGSAAFVSLLSQLASPWMFSTAVPPIACSALMLLLDELSGMSPERERILYLAERFRRHMTATPLRCSGVHHITGVHLPSAIRSADFEGRLRRAGYYVKISEYPSRPRGAPCCRITFTPFHHDDDVDRLVTALASAASMEE